MLPESKLLAIVTIIIFDLFTELIRRASSVSSRQGLSLPNLIRVGLKSLMKTDRQQYEVAEILPTP